MRGKAREYEQRQRSNVNWKRLLPSTPTSAMALKGLRSAARPLAKRRLSASLASERRCRG